MSRSPGPPPRLARLLGRLVPASARDDVLGDLRQEHDDRRAARGPARAAIWYAWQVAAIGVPFAAAGIWRAVTRGLATDLLDAARGLGRRPALVAAAVSSIGLGLGLAIAIFTVVNGLLFVPLPYAGADRLVEIDEIHPTEVCTGCSIGAPALALDAWRRARAFTAVEALDARDAIAHVGREPIRIVVAEVTPGLFEALGLAAARGRLPRADTGGDRAGDGADLVVLDHGFWTRHLGGRDVNGLTLRLDGRVLAIAGVLDPRTPLPGRTDAIVVARPAASTDPASDRRVVLARLAEGVSAVQAEDELRRLHPGVVGAARAADGWRPRVRPLRTAVMDDLDDPSAPALALVGALLVLFVASLNVCAILIAHVAGRTREFAVRRAIGADRRRLLRLVLGEVTWIAAIGTVVGLLAALGARGVIVQALAGVLPPWVTFPIDGRVVLAAVALAGGVVAVAGLAPAVAASVSPEAGLAGLLRDTVARQRRLRRLVTAQAAVGVVLLAGTIDALATARTIRDFTTLGHRVHDVVVVRTTPLDVRGPSDAGTGSTSDAPSRPRLEAGLRAVPGVRAVAAERMLFLGSWGGPGTPSALRLDGRPEGVPDAITPRHSLAVSPGWFAVMDIPIVRGRPIDERDTAGSAGAIVTSESAARTLWPDADPIGRVVHIEGWSTPLTVVGVAADVAANPLSASRRPLPRMYASLAQAPGGADTSWLIDTAETAPAAIWRDRVAAIAPDVLVTEVSSIEAGLRRWTASVAGMAWMLGVAGLMAMLLFAIGLHGTIGHQVASTRGEIGIRRALGASRHAIVTGTLGALGRALGASLVGGALLAWTAARGLGLPGVGSTAAGAIGLAALLVVVVAASVCLIAVRHALGIGPLEAIRT